MCRSTSPAQSKPFTPPPTTPWLSLFCLHSPCLFLSPTAWCQAQHGQGSMHGTLGDPLYRMPDTRSTTSTTTTLCGMPDTRSTTSTTTTLCGMPDTGPSVPTFRGRRPLRHRRPNRHMLYNSVNYSQIHPREAPAPRAFFTLFYDFVNYSQIQPREALAPRASSLNLATRPLTT